MLKEQTMWSGPSQPVEAQARMVAELVAMQREQAAVFHGQAEQLHDWSERRMQLIMSLTARLVPEHQRNLLCLSLRSAHGEDLFCLSQRSLCRLVQWHRPGVCLQARRCGPARQPPGKLPMCPNSVHIFCTATACHAVAPRTRLITSSTADCGQFPLPDGFGHCHIHYTAPNVENDKLSEGLQVLLFEDGSVCQTKTVLWLEESIIVF